jgi:hypothetical protein
LRVAVDRGRLLLHPLHPEDTVITLNALAVPFILGMAGLGAIALVRGHSPVREWTDEDHADALVEDFSRTTRKRQAEWSARYVGEPLRPWPAGVERRRSPL